MKPIVKFGLIKAGIVTNFHTVVIYGPQSLGCIRLFYLFVSQGAGRIYFLVKYYLKSTPSTPLLWANLSTLQL